ncbi:hypothetical protein ABI59_19840 [Acidobacteria bacterium Mor1]|nr:hypothetical protein ABI59_19840 [Acidobacteria bacterium Mor1]
MTAVAVWDRQPSAAELLDHRLEHGWQPTPSNLVDGARVLGYARCIAEGDSAAEPESESDA